MQLTTRNLAGSRLGSQSVGASIAAATATLLGNSLPTEVVAQELLPWDFDTAVLYYGESDGRVKDTSFNVLARKEVREESTLSLKLALDTLTGASPSGAAPARVAQTLTGPSKSGLHLDTAAPGALPLDSSFLDSRVAINANYEWPVSRLTLFNVGVSVSDEYDYTHTGVNFKLAHDFNDRNTTLSFGAAFASDTIDAVGGAPIAFSPLVVGGNAPPGTTSKDVTDLLFGVTQVINRKTIVQFNFSVSQSDGYLNDPYKLLSVVDPVLGDPTAAPPGVGLDYLYLHESRPDQREKQSLYGLLKRDIGGNVFDISYRYMTDDWDIDSHTIDMHYRWNFGSGSYFQPHLRFYSQTAASFYQTVLFDGAPLPAFATADYRLAEFDGITIGFKYGKPTNRGEMSGRLEFYQQTASPSPGSAVGSLVGLDLIPDLSAVIAQFSYAFGG